MLLTLACGPSLKQSAEAEQRHYRCFASDYDARVSSAQRRACWEAWLADDAEGQPVELVSFAEQRVAELSVDPSFQPLPDASGGPRPTYDHEFPISAPKSRLRTSCTPVCVDRWDQCVTRCQVLDKPCNTACRHAYTLCNGGCP